MKIGDFVEITETGKIAGEHGNFYIIDLNGNPIVVRKDSVHKPVTPEDFEAQNEEN